MFNLGDFTNQFCSLQNISNLLRQNPSRAFISFHHKSRRNFNPYLLCWYYNTWIDTSFSSFFFTSTCIFSFHLPLQSDSDFYCKLFSDNGYYSTSVKNVSFCRLRVSERELKLLPHQSQAQRSNDKTILGYHKIGSFISVLQINYLHQPSGSANIWQITILCLTLGPMTVKYHFFGILDFNTWKWTNFIWHRPYIVLYF